MHMPSAERAIDTFVMQDSQRCAGNQEAADYNYPVPCTRGPNPQSQWPPQRSACQFLDAMWACERYAELEHWANLHLAKSEAASSVTPEKGCDSQWEEQFRPTPTMAI